MTVRFKSKYASTTEYRIAYEVESRKGMFDEATKQWCVHYKIKGLNWFIPARKMELAEPSDIPAIDIVVALTNTSSKK